MTLSPDLLDTLLVHALDDRELEAQIFAQHARTVAILACDFTAMTQRTASDGIVYALALAAAARRVLAPVIEGHGGRVVRTEADTVFVVFDRPVEALLAALDGQRALVAFNRDRRGHVGDGSRRDPIHPSIGLGYGEVLLFADDVHGAEVNHAFVLGEDVATARETLASPAFIGALGTPPEGVGVWRGPEDREKVKGLAFHVVADYRDAG